MVELHARFLAPNFRCHTFILCIILIGEGKVCTCSTIRAPPVNPPSDVMSFLLNNFHRLAAIPPVCAPCASSLFAVVPTLLGSCAANLGKGGNVRHYRRGALPTPPPLPPTIYLPYYACVGFAPVSCLPSLGGGFVECGWMRRAATCWGGMGSWVGVLPGY